MIDLFLCSLFKLILININRVVINSFPPTNTFRLHELLWYKHFTLDWMNPRVDYDCVFVFTPASTKVQQISLFLIFYSGKSPYLLFTNRHEIRRIDLVKREYSQVVSTQKNAVALDLDVANNRVFWCDRFHRKIYR